MTGKNKKYLIILILALTVLSVVSIKSHAFRPSYFSAGLSAYSYDYSETQEEKGIENFSQERNLILGINLEAQYEFKFPIFIKGYIELAYFPTVYSGKTTSPITVYYSTTNNLFTRFELSTGYAFYISNIVRLSLYLGIGYRFWIRWLNPEVNGYREDYQWFYFIGGVSVSFKIGNDLFIGIDFSVRRMLWNSWTAYVTDLNNPAVWPQDSTLTLGNKTHFKIAVPFEYYFNKKYGLILTAWYYYSALGKSNIDDYYITIGTEFFEPKSTTHQAGLNANFVIYF